MDPTNKVSLELTDLEVIELRTQARYDLMDAENRADGNPDEEVLMSALKKLMAALGAY